MKKPFEPGLVVGMVLCGIVSFIATMELRKEKTLYQSTIEGLKKANTEQWERLESERKLTTDSFNQVIDSLKVAHEKTLIAHSRNQREFGKLREIVFRPLNDSTRIAELIKLYPSFKPL